MRRYLFVKGENPPFHTFPRNCGQRTEFAAVGFFARSAVRHRAESRGRPGAPVSDRHRAGARNPHQQRRPPPISRLRTAYRRSALNRGDMERRSSDRHRAGARNAHQRPYPPPISPLRTTYRRPAHESRGRPGAPVFRPASRGSAKPAPTTLRHTNLTAANGVSPICVESRGRWSAGLQTGIAREREMRTNDPAPRQSHRCERRIADLRMNRGDGQERRSSDRHRAGARNPHPQRRATNLTAANDVSPPRMNRGDGQERRSPDRHRAGARNPHPQRCAPPISRLRTAYRRSA